MQQESPTDWLPVGSGCRWIYRKEITGVVQKYKSMPYWLANMNNTLCDGEIAAAVTKQKEWKGLAVVIQEKMAQEVAKFRTIVALPVCYSTRHISYTVWSKEGATFPHIQLFQGQGQQIKKKSHFKHLKYPHTPYCEITDLFKYKSVKNKFKLRLIYVLPCYGIEENWTHVKRKTPVVKFRVSVLLSRLIPAFKDVTSSPLY